MKKHFHMSSSFIKRLDEHGVSASAVLRRAGLSPALLDQPRLVLKTEELFAFWSAVGEVSTNRAIGLLIGTETKTERFTLMGLTSLASKDFGEAVTQMARYKQITCPEEIRQEKKSGEWRITFHWLLANEVEPLVLIECAFSWMLSIARHGTGTRLSPLRVEFVEPRAHAKAIERHFGCPVLFGAPRNTIIFRAADAERPFVTRNDELLSVLAPQLEKDLDQQDGGESFVERVRSAIQQQLTGRRPTIDDIADALHVSSRSLQRHLQEEGFSFQQVLEEARRQLARHYLNNSVVDLNETAYLLGYEDSNSFVRAFRSWEGVPPGRWREKHGARAVS